MVTPAVTSISIPVANPVATPEAIPVHHHIKTDPYKVEANEKGPYVVEAPLNEKGQYAVEAPLNEKGPYVVEAPLNERTIIYRDVA